MPMAGAVKFDVEFARGHFPLLAGDWALFDNAAGTLVPESVIARTTAFLRECQVQPNNPYPASELATARLEEAKSQMAASVKLPTEGNVFVSVRDDDKSIIAPVGRMLSDCGLHLVATSGTHRVLAEAGIESEAIGRITGDGPNILDRINEGTIQLLVNTPTRKGQDTDEGKIRAAAVMHGIPMVTTITGAHATARAIAALKKNDWNVKSLQEYYETTSSGSGG